MSVDVRRDTLTRRMDVVLAEPEVVEKTVEFGPGGVFQSVEFTVTDNEKFKYRVKVDREELRDALKEYREVVEETVTCPF